MLAYRPKRTIIFKSTVPVGNANQILEKEGVDNIIFLPEFFREGTALFDDLYALRITVVKKTNKA